MAASGSKDEDLSNVEFETSEDVEVIASFDQMNLREDLLRGIYAYGKHDTVLTVTVTDGTCSHNMTT
jgi:hypothetical protein